MTRRSTVLAVLMFLAGCASGAGDDSPSGRPSPRHQEWAELRQGARVVRCFVVYPETARTAPAVLVIHENKGLTPWVRTVADRLAQEGFVAIAPDLLSGTGPGGGATEAFADEAAATAAIYKLPPDQVTADLHAAADYVQSRPGADGTLSVAGFCWGGTQTFRFATNRRGLTAAFVFYGSAPEDEAALVRIEAPVHGFYAENDARINAALPATQAAMRRAGKAYESVVYPGSGHGFMRAGEAADASPGNRSAREAAWQRWLGLLRGR